MKRLLFLGLLLSGMSNLLGAQGDSNNRIKFTTNDLYNYSQQQTESYRERIAELEAAVIIEQHRTP